MSPQSFRCFISVLVTLTFAIVGVSGLVLWLAPRGASGMQLGLSHGVWKESHIFVSITLLVAVAVHLVYNWSMLLRYLRNSTRSLAQASPVVAALLLTVVVVAAAATAGGGQGELPPLTAQSIAERSGCSVDEVTAVLKQQGLSVPAANASLWEAAKSGNIAPPQLMEIVQKHWPKALPAGPGRHAH